jgi:hypothetical protein
MITLWHDTKEKLRGRVMDLANGDAIKGRDFQVTRRVQRRRFVSRQLLPQEVFDRYARTQEVTMFYLRPTA